MTNRTNTRSIIAVVALALIMLPLLARLGDDADAATHANPAFERTWTRTDRPVAEGAAARTWMWGPAPFTDGLTEDYAQSADGTRTVQYYDKSRMEITNPGADSASDWYVTNGLLVTELVAGRMQTGDDRFEPRAAAAVNVAGDPDDPDGPTYATLAPLLDDSSLPAGLTIAWRVARDGTVWDDGTLAAYGVSASERVQIPGIDHRIADVFWTFMNSTGVVYAAGTFQHAALFPNPFYATGYPITEAYWTTVRVDGVPRDVLLQCFERRCLTYTPSNSDGWQVEAGNVGQHYYQWRYPGSSMTPTPTVPISGTHTPTTTAGCDAAYPDFCIPPPPPDLNCADIGQYNFTVLQPDPHNVDPDSDGIGCESSSSTVTSTRIPTATRTATTTATATATHQSTSTSTPTPTATRTPTLVPTATRTPTAAPTPTNTPSGGAEAECLNTQEYQFLLLINAYRDDNGLQPLADSTKLNIAAYRHSLDMGTRDYFSHDTQLPLPPGQAGPSPGDRMHAAGYTNYSNAGENIAAGHATAQAVFDAWKDSAPHNAAMLNPAFTQFGIGFAAVSGSTYTHYWTTDFANGNDGAPGC